MCEADAFAAVAYRDLDGQRQKLRDCASQSAGGGEHEPHQVLLREGRGRLNGNSFSNPCRKRRESSLLAPARQLHRGSRMNRPKPAIGAKLPWRSTTPTVMTFEGWLPSPSMHAWIEIRIALLRQSGGPQCSHFLPKMPSAFGHSQQLPPSWPDSSGPSPSRRRPHPHRFSESIQRQAACGEAARITVGRILTWNIYRRPLATCVFWGEAPSMTDRCAVANNPRKSIRSIIAATDLCRITPSLLPINDIHES